MRSFLAVEIPSDIRNRLREIQIDLRTSGADVKWVRPESIHLTLKFLGEIESEKVEDILRKVEDAVRGQRRFSLQVRGMGCFPRLSHPRVVWVGLVGDDGRLTALQQAVEDEMASLGFPRERRPFRPHLTLGRVRSAKGKIQLVSRIEKHSDIELGALPVESIVQFKSELHPKGAIYTSLGEVELG